MELKQFTIILPIKIGMHMYRIDYKGDVEELTVSMLQCKKDGTWKMGLSCSWGRLDAPIDEISNKYFYTKEEALASKQDRSE